MDTCRVLLNQLHAKNITSTFCVHNGISYESAHRCKAVLLQSTVFKRESSHKPADNTKQIKRECLDNVNLCSRQPDTSNTYITEINPFEDIYIKEENMENFSADEETIQDVTHHMTLKTDQNIHGHLEQLETTLSNGFTNFFSNDVNLTLGSKKMLRKSKSISGNVKKSLPRKFCQYSREDFYKEKTQLHKRRGNLLQCDKCVFKTFTSRSMKEHMHKHSGIFLQCDYCEFRSVYSHSLKEHMRKHADSLLQCEQCEFKTAYISHMNNHMKKHSGNLLQCEYCEYNTAYSSHMKRHELRKHNRDLLQCNQCNYSTTYSGNMRIHKRKHTGVLLQCEKCEFQTEFSFNMKKHTLNIHKHKGILLQCDQCEFKSAYSYNFNEHMRKHTDSLLKCGLCEYKTAYSSSMKKHMCTHSGNLLQCNFCEYSTAHSSHMNRHRSRKHKEDLVQREPMLL